MEKRNPTLDAAMSAVKNVASATAAIWRGADSKRKMAISGAGALAIVVIAWPATTSTDIAAANSKAAAQVETPIKSVVEIIEVGGVALAPTEFEYIDTVENLDAVCLFDGMGKLVSEYINQQMQARTPDMLMADSGAGAQMFLSGFSQSEQTAMKQFVGTVNANAQHVTMRGLIESYVDEKGTEGSCSYLFTTVDSVNEPTSQERMIAAGGSSTSRTLSEIKMLEAQTPKEAERYNARIAYNAMEREQLKDPATSDGYPLAKMVLHPERNNLLGHIRFKIEITEGKSTLQVFPESNRFIGITEIVGMDVPLPQLDRHAHPTMPRENWSH